MMKFAAGLLALGLCGTVAMADTCDGSGSASTCKSKAGDQKLWGGALRTFMAKCEADASAACETEATAKKLAGVAKAGFVGKCRADAVGL